MWWFIFFILLVIVFFSITNNTENNISTNNQIVHTFDFPTPHIASDKKVIDAIYNAKSYEINEVLRYLAENEHEVTGVLKLAFNEKQKTGSIDIEKYYKLIGEPSKESKTNVTGWEDLQYFKGKKINPEFLKPKKDIDNDSNIFYNRKVVITGDFESFNDRNEIAELLWNVGADIDTSISNKTDFVILGINAGWKKEEQIVEYGIKTISENEFIEIFNL